MIIIITIDNISLESLLYIKQAVFEMLKSAVDLLFQVTDVFCSSRVILYIYRQTEDVVASMLI